MIGCSMLISLSIYLKKSQWEDNLDPTPVRASSRAIWSTGLAEKEKWSSTDA